MENLESTIPAWVSNEANDREFNVTQEADLVTLSLKSSKSNFSSGCCIDSKTYLKDPSKLWRLIFDKYSEYQEAYPLEYQY